MSLLEYNLYGPIIDQAYNDLKRKRSEFLSPQLGTKGRGKVIQEHLHIPCKDGGVANTEQSDDV